jgi:mono/diheme cytochrome c family protein
VAFTSGNVGPSGTAAGAVGRPTVVVMALPQPAVPAIAMGAVSIDVARGKSLYGQLCAGCHGPDGARIADKSLKAAAARLDAAQLGIAIMNPAGAMPKIFPTPRGAEDERDIRDIAAYVDAGTN